MRLTRTSKKSVVNSINSGKGVRKRKKEGMDEINRFKKHGERKHRRVKSAEQARAGLATCTFERVAEAHTKC
jgi:hypothetical protein